MNVAVVGGSGHSTPHLVCAAREVGDLAFRLIGRSPERLAAVARACRLDAADSACVTFTLDRLTEALAGADLLIVQMRVGGYRARAWDERFPHRHGSYGDEGLGLGGAAAAWRTWPVLEALLAEAARVAPATPVLLLTSPVGILTRLAHAAFPALAVHGICELPWTTLCVRCAAAGVDPLEAAFTYVGVNHWGWFTAIEHDGRPLIDAPLPLSYVELLEQPDAVRERQQRARARGSELGELAASSYAAFRHGDAGAARDALARRPAPWYRQAVIPYLCGAVADAAPVPVFLTTRNDGAHAWLADDDVVELPHRRSGGRWRADRGDATPPDFLIDTLRALLRYERAAAEAVAARDRRRLGHALALHPSLTAIPVTPALVDDVVAAY